MNATDRNALERAVEIARQDPVERRRIDERLAKGESWDKVAGFCAAHCQSEALDLMPWQSAPLWFANHLDSVLREPFGDPSGRREAGEVLQRLLRNGFSKFELNPVAALTQAEGRDHLLKY
ncbi:hypothetical protein ACVWXN_001187 [Bradyrhizobium sp. i1.4.4]